MTFGKVIAKKTTSRVAIKLGLAGARDETSSSQEPAQEDYVREFAPVEVVASQLQSLIDRGVQMFWVYTAGMPKYYNYEGQFFDFFASVNFKGRVKHRYFGDANHTFTEMRSQQRLVADIVNWMSAAFPRVPVSSSKNHQGSSAAI
jgi:hypothetical protein